MRAGLQGYKSFPTAFERIILPGLWLKCGIQNLPVSANKHNAGPVEVLYRMGRLSASRRLVSCRSVGRLFALQMTLLMIVGFSIAPAFSASVHIRTTALDNVQPAGYTPYHNGATLLCGDCHISHAEQQHDYTGAKITTSGSTSSGLLKGGGINELCLSCHDGKAGIPDVVGPDINGLKDRSAGMFQNPGENSWKGHSLALGERTSSSCDKCHSTGRAELVCTDCHSPHGNKRPRNLRWASDPGIEPQFGLFVSSSATGMAKYEASNVAYGTTDDDMLREVSNMCVDCHHNFSGSDAIGGGPTGGHIRHPSYDSERMSINTLAKTSSISQHWMNGTGSGFEIDRVRFLTVGARDFTSASTVNSPSNGVFCLSCHKAHGSSHPFGMAWDTTGGTSIKGCGQCHDL